MSHLVPITFGTDGWRAVIGDDFTYASLRRVARAAGAVWAADYGAERPNATIIVGYDTRFQAGSFARAVAEELAACGLRVKLSDAYLPTPALCYAVSRDARAVGGVMLTASHNPAEYLGFKVRMADGGASPVEFTARIEAALAEQPAEQPASPLSPEEAARIETVDLVSSYQDALYAMVDTDRIESYVARAGGLKVVVDPLFGAGQEYLSKLLRDLGIDVREIHAEINPSFGGLHPEPIPPWTDTARAVVLANRAAAGFITDGDADRIGAIDETGRFISPHRIIALVAQHLVEDRHKRGRIVKTLSTSSTIDLLGRALGCTVTTTPIGFKWIYAEMLKGDVLLGGEESGGIGVPTHVRERDGLLMALLLTEMMATRGKTLKQLVDDLLALVGETFYRREDLRIEPAHMQAFRAAAPSIAPETVADRRVRRTVRTDGIKFIFDKGEWLLLRPSGTEPLVRVYAEAVTEAARDDLIAAGIGLVDAAQV